MNPALFNLPEDGWFHIAAFGEWPHKPTGLTQIIDEESADEIIKAFTEFAAAPNWPGVLVDFDHQSLDQDKPTVAAGWIGGLQKRPTGLWAQIRWSDLGRKSLEGGRYRFISPVWRSSDCAKLGDDRIRPLKLMNCAVTNDPNIKGLFPLSNSAKADTRIVAPPMEIPHTPGAPPSSGTKPAKPTVSIPAAFLRNRRPLTDKQRRYLHAQRGRETSGPPTSGTSTNPFTWGAPSSPSSAAPPATPSPTGAAPGPQSGNRVRSLAEAKSIAREIANLPPGATAEDINAILDKYRTRPTQGRAAKETSPKESFRKRQAERTADQLSKKEDWELAHQWEAAERSYNRAVKLGDESTAKAWIGQMEAIAAEAARRTGQAAPEAVAAAPTAPPGANRTAAREAARLARMSPSRLEREFESASGAAEKHRRLGNVKLAFEYDAKADAYLREAQRRQTRMQNRRAELEFLRNSSFMTDDQRKAMFARLGAGYSYGGPRATRDHDMRIRSYDQQMAALEASRQPRPERGDYDYRDWRETKARLMAAGAGSGEILAAINADKAHNRAVRDRINQIKRDLKKVYKTKGARERAYQRRMDHEKRNHEKAVRDWEKSEDSITKAIRGLGAKRDEEVAKKADSELKAQAKEADRALKLDVKNRQLLERAYREYEKTQRQREKDQARADLAEWRANEQMRRQANSQAEREAREEMRRNDPVALSRAEQSRIREFNAAILRGDWRAAESLDRGGNLRGLHESLKPIYELGQRDRKAAAAQLQAQLDAYHREQYPNPWKS